MGDIRLYILAAPVIIFSLTVHEFSHAWTANKLGDPTAKNMGRMTLNPMAHLDIFGTLMLFLSGFRFGWAKPVPVNPYNLRNVRRDDLWISAAGPISNLILALIAGTIFRVLGTMDFLGSSEAVYRLLYLTIMINSSLAFFNLLPVFPLDGSHILRGILPAHFGPTLDQIERVSPMVLIGLILFGFMTGYSIIWMIMGPFVKAIVLLVSGLHV